uniref:VAN3-binding protein-like auxin canalisation domain-containing protein n=1 Tax=Oryza brachyantha TaxID=4533 RepID=J3LFZ9_ORYBR
MGQTVKFGRVPFKIGFSHSQSRPKVKLLQIEYKDVTIKISGIKYCFDLVVWQMKREILKYKHTRNTSKFAWNGINLLDVMYSLHSIRCVMEELQKSTSACFGNGGFDQGKDDQGNHEGNNTHNVNKEIKQTMDGIQMTVGGVVQFFKTKLANMVQRGCGRKREDIRLQTAQMHAALSVSRLATAVARMVGNCHSESTEANNTVMTGIGQDEHKKMHAAIASAAALVAASCAEAAKLTGASREQISSVIHMGMETRALGDLLMLTTSAATCLKGANALKTRNLTISNYALEDHMSHQKGVRLLIRTPDDIIFDEHGGTIDFSYPTDGHSYHAINLATSGGNIQLLFEEHEQYSTWKSFIRYLIISKRSRLSY